MSLSDKNIYFFFPYKSVGGVQNLFLILSELISKKRIFKNVYLVDYKSGYMAANYNKDGIVELVEYSISKNIYFDDFDIVVFQSLPLSLMPLNLIFSEKTKIIYWCLHPYNFGNYTRVINGFFKNNKLSRFLNRFLVNYFFSDEFKTIKLFLDNKSICFMDDANVKSIERIYGCEIENPILIPLVVRDIVKLDYEKPNSISLIRALWIGRVCDFKVYVLLYTIKKLAVLAPGSEFTVIGNGELLEYLKSQVKKISTIKVFFEDYIDMRDVANKVTQYNIGFAMGTAALDMAKHGLPTILLDAFYSEITYDYEFKWLFETKGFTLGSVLDVNGDDTTVLAKDSLLDRISELFLDYDKLSEKCFSYVINLHEEEVTVNRFLDFIKEAEFTYGLIPKSYFKFNIIQRLTGQNKRYCEFSE